MKRLSALLFIIIVVSLGYVIISNPDAVSSLLDKQKEIAQDLTPSSFEQELTEDQQGKESSHINKEDSKEDTSPPPQDLEGDSAAIASWIGQSSNEVIEKLGEPSRKDQTPYGYEWWIYPNGTNRYMQLGILNEEVVSSYGVGDVQMQNIATGDSYEEITSNRDIQNEVEVTNDRGSFQFRLSSDDKSRRPLLALENGNYAQLYFDTFKGTLSSIRIMNSEVLLRHRPYEVYYRGDLPEEPSLSREEWEVVEKGLEQQIFDISNQIRNRFEEVELSWDDQVASVAFGHSKDMAVDAYFAHVTPEGKGLKERLQANSIQYLSAGENIAAKYPDAPAVVEGWLNSKGHREALLHPNYTHLGVGVYEFHYTQNFIEKSS